MAEMLAVPAAAAALLHPFALGQRQRRFAYDGQNRLKPLRMHRRGIDRETGIDQATLAVVDVKHLAGKSPEVVDRGLRAGVALLVAIAAPPHPSRPMPQLIGTFFFELCA